MATLHLNQFKARIKKAIKNGPAVLMGQFQRKVVFMIMGAVVDLDKRAIESTGMSLSSNPGRFLVINGLLQQSPVDKGTFRANWNVSSGQPDLSYDLDKTFGGGKGSPPSGEEYSKIDSGTRGGMPFKIVWIGNHVPYARRLNEGHSKQAPAGFFESTVHQVEAML